MKWFDIFKLYNLKKMKSEKVIFIFVSLSIFVTTLISLLVPQITENTKEYMYSSIEKLNGADLMIKGEYPSAEFNKEIENIRDEGCDIKFQGISNCYFKNNSGRNTVGRLIYGNNDIGENKIILYKSIAENMNVDVGDEVWIDSTDGESKKYIVKEIEDMPYAVDADSKVLGYGKIDSVASDLDISKTNSYIVLINGMDGEDLKDRLSNVEDGFTYTSLEDREKSVQSDIDRQILSFSVVTTMAYVLSIITIISTTIMIILRRKKDFAILKVLAIPEKNIRRAMFLEISLMIVIPILLASVASFGVSTLIINITQNVNMITTGAKVAAIVKGVVFNCVLFFIFLNIVLTMLKSIKALSIIRENEDETKKAKKKIIRISVLALPILLLLYSLYVGRLATFGGACLIMIFVLIFLALISLVIKLLSLIPFKNNVLVYGFNNIRKNLTTFIMISSSITITIVFLLVGFTLSSTIEESIDTSVESTLPFDHIVLKKGTDNFEKELAKTESVKSYSKLYKEPGKVTNSNIKNRGISLSQVKKEEYNAQYTIEEGEDIFEGSSEDVLISKKYSRATGLKVGDYLNIETLNNNLRTKIKGIYEGGEFNSTTILKQYDGSYCEDISYLINSNDLSWMDLVEGDSYIVSVDTYSSSISTMLNKVFNIFKYLCILCIFSSIIFNTNMVYMDYMENKKDETIIVAMGLGKEFCKKYQLFKFTLVVLTSTVLSFGVYVLVIKVALKLVFNSNTYISPLYLLISLIISIVLSLISFNSTLRNLKKKPSFELLRE